MKSLLKRKESPVLLGLRLEGGQLEGVLLRRNNGTLEVAKTFAVPLTLDVLNNEAELVGQEIRNQLEAAGVRERRCAVCVPLKWAMTLSTTLPEMPEEDVAEFLQIEAERGFSVDAEELLIARSRYRTADGTGHATQIAVPLSHLTRLEEALTAAGLKPVTFSLGIAALQPPGSENAPGVIALAAGADSVDLQVTIAGGVVTMRSLEAVIESEGGRKEIDGDQIARELRITLGQLPPEVRAGMQSVRVFGPDEVSRQLAEELRPAATAMGLKVERVTAYGTGELGLQLPAGVAVSEPVSLAARRLAGAAHGLEFLPPKVSAWQMFVARYSSQKLVATGATAGAIALLVLIGFLYQQYRISTLESEWARLKPGYETTDDLQKRIRKFRPWFDTGFSTLTLMKRVTEAFPESGVVTAKTLEIRNQSVVNITGTTRDVLALNKTQADLQKLKEVKMVKVDNVRGDAVKNFSLIMQWGEGGTGEN